MLGLETNSANVKTRSKNMLQLFIVTLSLLPWIPASLCRVTVDPEFTVLEGGSLTIPCHYEPQYASYVKYWCQGRTRELCSTLARTDAHHVTDPAEEKVSIFDDPVQLLFTVTMRDLKEADSGWHMCGIEIGNMWRADDASFTHIKVVHGMSAVNSRMSGEEGSSVTVECLYSERYRESEKKWCRSGDWRSCLSTGSAGSYEDSSVAIRDDRTRAFSVTFKKLQKGDTAWYWCSAGQQKVAVHVLVTPQLTTTSPVTPRTPTSQPVALVPAPKPVTREFWSSNSQTLAFVVVCSLVVFVVAVGLAVFARKMWKLHKSEPLPGEVERMKAKFRGYSGEAGDFQSASVVFLNKDSYDM